jgi:GxxExxY protein
MDNPLFENETYKTIGLCMEVHRIPGHGFSEIIYKDDMMVEAALKDIQIQRETEFTITYKLTILKHSFLADFVFYDNYCRSEPPHS